VRGLVFEGFGVLFRRYVLVIVLSDGGAGVIGVVELRLQVIEDGLILLLCVKVQGVSKVWLRIVKHKQVICILIVRVLKAGRSLESGEKVIVFVF
jgi:hypothetical protein